MNGSNNGGNGGNGNNGSNGGKATRTRTNHVLARVIDEGIQIDAVKGAANAWAYLMAHSVDPQTILRVLSNAAARRRESGYAKQLRT
ncbi:hypothetical protein LJR289_001911 [Pseudoduganella sp. LjRoot289]|uniref:hypothetical protein n=1 Tax=Pseudoduganella sp. LjRoot289 TaxID=3342314 RepID=UPI003ECCD1CF